MKLKVKALDSSGAILRLETDAYRSKFGRSGKSRNLDLNEITEDNTLFTLFYEYLQSLHCPPFLQFLLKTESFKILKDKETMNLTGKEIMKMFFSFNDNQLPMEPKILYELQTMSDFDSMSFDKAIEWVKTLLENNFVKRFMDSSQEIEFYQSSKVVSKALSEDSIFLHKTRLRTHRKVKSMNDVGTNYEQNDENTEKSILTSISNLKEQIFHINEKLESATKTEKKELLKTRTNLSDQLEPLIEIITNKNDRKSINFSNSVVRIEQFSESQTSSVLNFRAELEFQLWIEYPDSDIPFVDCVKTFTEFQQLHKALGKMFPKVKMISFPSKAKPSTIPKQLETFIKIVINDNIINQSLTLKNFLQVREKFSESSTSLYSHPSLSDASLMQDTVESFKDLTDSEVDLLFETVFAFIVEAFDLQDNTQWFRLKILEMVKQMVRQAYNESLNQFVTETLNSNLNPQKIADYIDNLTRAIWPDGANWTVDRTKKRTAEEKIATREKAKKLIGRNIPDLLFKMVGRYNALVGINNLFNSIQFKQQNIKLINVLLDILIKLLFSEKK